MGNKPSEYKGCNCYVCGTRLSPCKKFKNFKREERCERKVFSFNEGEYFREIERGEEYECTSCFHKKYELMVKARKEEKERRKKEEEEERKRREERKKREVEKKREEEEWKMEEERKKKREEEERKMEEERKKKREEQEEEEMRWKEALGKWSREMKEKQWTEDEEKRKMKEDEENWKEEETRQEERKREAQRKEEDRRYMREEELEDKRWKQEWMKADETLKETWRQRQQLLHEETDAYRDDGHDDDDDDDCDDDKDGSSDHLLELLSEYCGSRIPLLDLREMELGLAEQIFDVLKLLLLGDWATGAVPRTPTLQRIQKFLIQLLESTCDVFHKCNKTRFADKLQSFIAIMSKSSRDQQELLLMTQSLTKIVDVMHNREVPSKMCKVKMLRVAKVWRRVNLDREKHFYVTFLEAFLYYSEHQKSGVRGGGGSDDGGGGGDTVTGPERTCFEFLIETALCEMGASRGIGGHAVELVNSGLWSPLHMINILHTLAKSLRDSPVIVNFLSSLNMYRIPESWCGDAAQEGPYKGRRTSKLNEGFLQRLIKSFGEEDITSLEDIIEKIRAQHTVDDGVLFKTRLAIDTVLKNINNGLIARTDAFKAKFPRLDFVDTSSLETVLWLLCTAVHESFGWWPRVTQMVGWCLLTLSTSRRLLEIGTGEGKSCVIAMFAASRVLVGRQKVDVVSSSPVLSERDAREWLPFYDLLGVTVATNTNVGNDKERCKCYGSDVVYGTIESFAADHLRQIFEMKEVRPNRSFECIIVDEVDFLLLDQGVQFTYLSSDTLGMQHLNLVLAMIWSMVTTFTHVHSLRHERFISGPPMPFHVAAFNVLDAEDQPDGGEGGRLKSSLQLLQIAEDKGFLPGGFTKEIGDPNCKPSEARELLKSVNQDMILEFMRMLQDNFPFQFVPYTLDERGRLQPETLCCDDDGNIELDRDLMTVYILVHGKGSCSLLYDSEETLIDRITKIVSDTLCFEGAHTGMTEKVVKMPGFLEKIVRAKMPTWVENAFLARKLEEGRQYLVEVDQIIPVDFRSTGVVQLNRKWGDGLQQFLEMKHWTKLSSLTAITNFISNMAYLELYGDQLYGTSGTLGPESDQRLLQKLYPKLSFCVIPPFKTKLLFESRGIVQRGDDAWLQSVCSAVRDEVSPRGTWKGRAALVICEDINRARRVCEAVQMCVLGGRVHLYYRNDGSFDVSIEKLRPGDVVVATNLAGRGTDIKVTEEVEASGGLFVALTFLTQNQRVERQAFGRTARKGQPGSARVIVCTEHAPRLLRGTLTIDVLKRRRDATSVQQAERVLEEDLPEVRLMEKLFAEYCVIKRGIHGEIEDADRRNVAVSVLNDYWGMWLQLKAEDIRELKEEELLRSLRADLQIAKLSLESDMCPSHNIYHFINFGNAALIENRQMESMELYEKAMQMDPAWAAIAYYNHAYCLVKNRPGHDFIDQALKDLENAKESLRNFEEQVTLISLLVQKSGPVKASKEKKQQEKENKYQKQKKKEDEEITEEEASQFTLQFQLKIQVLDFFKNNIVEAIKNLKEIKSNSQNKAVTESSIFSLGLEAGTEVFHELIHFMKLGLKHVFSYQKPQFCWEGLVVFTLGVAQIATGVLLLVLCSGIPAIVATTFINEGISDCLKGIKAMISGEFNWESWAVEKSFSIALSLGYGIGCKLLFKAATKELTPLNVAKKVLQKVPSLVWKYFEEDKNKVINCVVKKAVAYVGEEMLARSAAYLVNRVQHDELKLYLERMGTKVRDSVAKQLKISLQSGRLGVTVDEFLLSNPDLLSEPDGPCLALKIMKTLASEVLKPSSSCLKLHNRLNNLVLNVITRARSNLKPGTARNLLSIITTVYMRILTANAITAVKELREGFEPLLCDLITTRLPMDQCHSTLNKGGETDHGGEAPTDEAREKLEKVKEDIAGVLSKELADTIAHMLHLKLTSHLDKLAKRGMNSLRLRDIPSNIL